MTATMKTTKPAKAKPKSSRAKPAINPLGDKLVGADVEAWLTLRQRKTARAKRAATSSAYRSASRGSGRRVIVRKG